MKEDSVEVPLVVPRAPLPEGAPNYVTRRGLAALREERAALEASRPTGEGATGAAELAAHHARLSALDARIASAVTPAGPLLCVRPYCANDHYWQVYFDTNRVIRETFGAAGFPAPVQQFVVMGEGPAPNPAAALPAPAVTQDAVAAR